MISEISQRKEMLYDIYHLHVESKKIQHISKYSKKRRLIDVGNKLVGYQLG